MLRVDGRLLVQSIRLALFPVERVITARYCGERGRVAPNGVRGSVAGLGTISRHRDWNAVFVGGVVEQGAMRVYRE